MSIWSSLYTGRSGLTAHGDAINVVGDNIANVSTVGFKAGSANFNDVLGRRTGGGQALGAGVQMGSVSQGFGQGSFIQSGGSLDYAIQGAGFFAVAGEHNGVDNTYYTRNGRFSLNSEGLVVNEQGLRLQGYGVDANGEAIGAAGDIEIAGTSSPVPTTMVDIAMNLNVDEDNGVAFDPTDPLATADHATEVTVYDSLGNPHTVHLCFENNGAGAWEWHAFVMGDELSGGTPNTLTEIADGTLTFDGQGRLETETLNASSADFNNATPGQSIQFDFGEAIITDGGDGSSGTTQNANDSGVTSVDQDGREPGELVDIITSDDGSISGLYSNGETEPLAKLAIASFRSPGNLDRAGDQMWTASSESGQALLGEAGTAGRGSVSSNALEGSNVDLGDELVTLIAYQRAFQANARTVTTADEMLTEIANLKR